MEILGRIRRMYLRDNMSLHEIAKRTGLSRNTVRSWLRTPEEVKEPVSKRKPGFNKLGAHVAELELSLKADALRPKQDRRTARALFAQIKASGYVGSYTRVTDFIRAWRADAGKGIQAFVPLRFETCRATWPCCWPAAGGQGSAGQVVSPQGVNELLTPAAPLRRFKLGATDFEFRYGQGWLVGPFGAATDARWHQGALAAFEAWAVLLPDTKQAVVLLINAKSDLPFNGLDAVTSRLPIGVVNLLRGQPAPEGPSLQQAYRPFNTACAVAIIIALWLSGLNARMLSAFAPDVALVVVAALVLLCLPAALRAGTWARGAFAGPRQRPP